MRPPLALLWLLWLIATPCLRAETFFGPTSPGNKLLIASNESVIISSVTASATLTCDLAVSNLLYAVHLFPSGMTRIAIAGPAELKVPAASAIYFKRLQNLSV